MFTPPRPTREFLLADDGSATVEYVIGLLTAAIFAGSLLLLIKGDKVSAELMNMIDRAFSVT